MHWLIEEENRANIHLQHSFYERKRFILKRKESFFYTACLLNIDSLFIKHWVYDKLKYILPIYVLNIGHIKRLIYYRNLTSILCPK